MKDKKWLLGLVIIVLVIGTIAYLGFRQADNKTSNSPQVAGENVGNKPYYDENAAVMEFYSDYCSWCLKQKEVLEKLGAEGYKVKPMNVGENAGYWQQYDIKGTPTFIAKNGDRLEGFNDYEKLKKWLDEHK